MAIRTTTIGAYPKPDFLEASDWFDMDHGGPDAADPTGRYAKDLKRLGDGAENQFVRAAEAVIGDQVEVGIDIVTDGEVRRENYIHYHCRHIDGIDFTHLTETAVRGVTMRQTCRPLHRRLGPLLRSCPMIGRPRRP